MYVRMYEQPELLVVASVASIFLFSNYYVGFLKYGLASVQ